MGKIKKISEKESASSTQRIDVYPVTSTKAVYDTGNKVLDDYIQHLKKTSTFAGIATPTTNPGTPDGPVFYFANQEGTYTNFNDIKLLLGDSSILTYSNGVWEKIPFQALDSYHDSDPTNMKDALIYVLTHNRDAIKPMTAFDAVFDTDGKSLTDVIENILYTIGGELELDISENYEKSKGWDDNFGDIDSMYYNRTIVDVQEGHTYKLSFRTLGGMNRTYFADNSRNKVGDNIGGGVDISVVAPKGATKLYISTNITGSPNAISVKEIIPSKFVEKSETDNVLLDDKFVNSSWTTDMYYQGDGVFNIANGILTIGPSSGRKFVQRRLNTLEGYDNNGTYLFEFTLRRTSANIQKPITIGTCYKSTADSVGNEDVYEEILPTSDFRTYSFIGKIYKPYGMVKIGAETAFDGLEVSNVKITKLTEQQISDLDVKCQIGITCGQSLQKIINKYPHVILPSGITEITYPLTIPDGRVIEGAKNGSTLKLLQGDAVMNIVDVSGVTIKGVSFVGDNSISATDRTITEIKSRTGEGNTVGIAIKKSGSKAPHDVTISDCLFSNFSKAGIWLYNSFDYSFARFVKITDCNAYNCWCGVIFDNRAEYNIISNCSFSQCQYGALVLGGNNKFSNCAFENNGVGFIISGTLDGETAAPNNSHGIISNSSFNHCLTYGIVVIDADNGFTFLGCHTYGNTADSSKGGIYISNSIGVNYNGGVVGCQIDIDALKSGMNMICNSMFDGGSYNSGIINGDKSKLSLHGNRDYKGTVSSTQINNEL